MTVFFLWQSILRGLTTTFANVWVSYPEQRFVSVCCWYASPGYLSTVASCRTSVVMVSRLMLNIQNPALFGNHHARTAGGHSEANNLGPFVATAGSRRRRSTSLAFWAGGLHATQEVESLGDPAWHRETQIASQTTDTTDTTDSGELFYYGLEVCGIDTVALAYQLAQMWNLNK